MWTPSRETTFRPRISGRPSSLRVPSSQYPERLNCAAAFLDRWVDEGTGRRALPDQPGRDAHLSRASGAREPHLQCAGRTSSASCPGNRVLLRSANNPMMVAAYLAVLKAGGVVVATMPLLRAREIAYPMTKAKIALALCDHRLADEMERARRWRPICSVSSTGAPARRTGSRR